jgi:hypothetical protein
MTANAQVNVVASAFVIYDLEKSVSLPQLLPDQSPTELRTLRRFPRLCPPMDVMPGRQLSKQKNWRTQTRPTFSRKYRVE